MAINPIQININNTKSVSFKKKEYKSYLQAEGAVDTTNNVKPLPGKGHLIHDGISNKVKYFFKDIAYDFKSIKNAFNGTANDHQSGRLNDVGLKLSGIGIATYLASKTTDPRARLMEYVGLGAFLAAMDLYPKLAINKPAELIHGFEIDKQFIDDQGRKKSVYQDSNYIPYDLYRGEAKGESLEEIGDNMGIPKNIVNRNDLTREQTRKIATQSNTLWMLTACATPAMTALICRGLEEPLGYGIQQVRNAKHNNRISKMLQKTTNMTTDVNSIKTNGLSHTVENLISKYKGEELPQEVFEKISNLITKDIDANTSEGIKEDLARILRSGKNGADSYVVNASSADNIVEAVKKLVPKNNSDSVKNALIPTKAEIETILEKYAPKSELEKGATLTKENISEFRTELSKLIESKTKSLSDVPADYLKNRSNSIVEGAANVLQTKKSNFVSENVLKDVVNFAKVIGDFKNNDKLLDSTKSFKFEFAPQTVIARSYNKFQDTLLKELKISYKDLKLMEESEKATAEIFDKKLTELCKDEARYNKTVKKLGKIISDMEIQLDGKNADSSHIKDLITAIENNYNKTAQRLAELDSNKFKNTIDKLVKEDPKTLSNTVTSKTDLREFLDGIRVDKYADINNIKYWSEEFGHKGRIDYAKHNAKGIGSSKNFVIDRIVDRYSGAKNSFYRTLHLFDVYKRAANPADFSANPEYANELINKGKATLMTANSSEHTLKLNTINGANFYKDLFNTIWKPEDYTNSGIKSKGFVTDTTKAALKDVNEAASGNVLDRFQQYIMRFKHIVGNNDIDFTKPEHKLDTSVLNKYEKSAKTRLSIFNLVGQNPAEMLRNSAKNKYASTKWLRIMSVITAGIFSTAILAQFGFGKIRNPQNIKKQVNDEVK
ncbi:MAG: hypothetical protein E7Z89_00510 [Cyanobacteria bacterium SIG28]|nr:hypothetical protein [Cyanobacteria bacterium SIG28]